MHRKLAVSVLFLSSMFSLRSLAENGEPEPEQLTVAIYNDAGIPADVLHRAEQRATRIFSEASFEVVWIHCLLPKAEDTVACRQTNLAEHLALRIIRNPVKSTSDAVFGVAFLSGDGSGKYGDVFWRRAQDLHAISNLDIGSILGSVMAHEMGHLMLGSNAHAVSGIMRAHWESEELRRIAMGTLLFTPQQAERMRGGATLAAQKQPIVSDSASNHESNYESNRETSFNRAVPVRQWSDFRPAR